MLYLVSMRVFSRVFAIMAMSVTVGSALAQQEVALNVAANYADAKAAMIAGEANIVCIGDSLTFRNDGWVPTVRSRLQSMHGNAGEGWMPLPNFTPSNVQGNWYWPPLNADVYPYRGLNGFYLQAASSLPVSMTQRSWNSRFDLYFISQSFGPTVHVDSPGWPRTSINSDILPHGSVQTVSMQTWNFAPFTITLEGSGSLVFLGLNCETGLPGVKLHVAANGGFGVDNFIQRNSSYEQILQSLEPDLYIVQLGQNDRYKLYPEFKQKMGQVIDRLQAATPGVEIILLGSYNTGVENMQQRIDAQRDLARERGLGFIDLFNTLGDSNFFQSNGYLREDGTHWTFAGGKYVGNAIFDALESGGASLASRCGDIDFNNDGLFPDDGDLIDFLTLLAGGSCSTDNCDRIDFVRDGLFPSDDDLLGFLQILAGGSCPL